MSPGLELRADCTDAIPVRRRRESEKQAALSLIGSRWRTRSARLEIELLKSCDNNLIFEVDQSDYRILCSRRREVSSI